MTSVEIHLKVTSMSSGRWVGQIRRDDQGMPLALGRPHDTYEQAYTWALAQAHDEFKNPHGGDEAA